MRALCRSLCLAALPLLVGCGAKAAQPQAATAPIDKAPAKIETATLALG
jgi:hypothetical protein